MSKLEIYHKYCSGGLHEQEDSSEEIGTLLNSSDDSNNKFHLDKISDKIYIMSLNLKKKYKFYYTYDKIAFLLVKLKFEDKIVDMHINGTEYGVPTYFIKLE